MRRCTARKKSVNGAPETVMNKFKLINTIFGSLLRPILFSMDCEKADNLMVNLGEKLENSEKLLESIFAYRNEKLNRRLLGIDFTNPIGLGAGFDYDGHMAKTMQHLGFGFNTVGSVTAKPYAGNPLPRLTRLVKSKSILVNKGFKSDGAVSVAKRLDRKNLVGHTVGISVGNSNIPEVDTLNKAIDDYLFTFDIFRKKKYVKYFELNISCPNITIREAFKDYANVKKLIKAVKTLHLPQPIFMKMHNEITEEESDRLVRLCLNEGISGFIFSNLIGNRKNPALDREEIAAIQSLKGGLSGRPTAEGSNILLRRTRAKFGKEVVLVGSGGVFTPEDAILKFTCGADLIQVVTGFIFEGPQIAGNINYGITHSDAS